ncbi:MAG TPA: hypothetical protein VE377_25610 [Candidatus Dormibacteraeota bacterium]|nr:hypothetical protein [Candidatus Dormibacteraeota bacterium]
MAQVIPPKVNPGDLITASYMDSIIDALIGLDQRLSQLESTGAVANTLQITGVTATQPIHIGDQIEIDGTGFIVPAVLNQISMGGSQVSQISTGLSSPSKLVFTVPNIPGVSSTPTPVTVTVVNTNGSAVSPFQIMVQAANAAPVGDTQLVFSTPPVLPVGQTNIQAGQNYTFGFDLTAVTNLPVNYSVSASVTGTGWTAQLQSSSSVSLAAGAKSSVSVQVTAGTGSGVVTVTATETTPGTKVKPGNGTLTVTTGSPPPTPVTSIIVTLSSASFGASVSGAGVAFTRNQLGIVAFTILLTNAGNGYTASAAMLNSNGWLQGTLSGSPFNIQPAPPPGQTASTPVSVQFTAQTGAAATSLVLTVKAPDGTTVSYGLPVTVA